MMVMAATRRQTLRSRVSFAPQPNPTYSRWAPACYRYYYSPAFVALLLLVGDAAIAIAMARSASGAPRSTTLDVPPQQQPGSALLLVPSVVGIEPTPCDESVTCPHFGVCSASGFCECPEVCVTVYNPVCDSNGNQHSNECFLRVAICQSRGEIGKGELNDCPLRVGDVCKSGGPTTGPGVLVDREQDCPVGTRCRSMGDEAATSGGNTKKYCDCDDGTFARDKCGDFEVVVPQKECVVYQAIGESCGGFTLPCFETRCQPGQKCLDLFHQIADEPGKCSIKCSQEEATRCSVSGGTMDPITCECQEGSGPAGDKKCSPGCILYFDGCNDCVCHNGGAKMACTEMFCKTPYSLPPRCKKKTTTCKDGCQAYFDGCNNCFCMSNGELACTKMACPNSESGSRELTCTGYANSTHIDTEEKEPLYVPSYYKNGTVDALYLDSNANISVNGDKLACGEQGCKTTFDGCNTCQCLATGGMACTEKMCTNETRLAQWQCLDGKSTSTPLNPDDLVDDIGTLLEQKAPSTASAYVPTHLQTLVPMLMFVLQRTAG